MQVILVEAWYKCMIICQKIILSLITLNNDCKNSIENIN